MVTLETLKKNEEIRTYITRADESLRALGYTEHSFAHVVRVAETAAYILKTMGYDEKTVELARIAGFLHDIGNLVNREGHSQSGAVIAFRLLDKLEMPAGDVATIVTAIGNHDESSSFPVNAVAAALILADKTDVRRTRVRNIDPATFDIHDRVNYSVEESLIEIDERRKNLLLKMQIDQQISPVMSYFEIFLERMKLCCKAAQALGLRFRLVINEQTLL